MALRRHLNRVYLTADAYSQVPLSYLIGQMRTPTTLFDDERCLVLPNPADGPAVLLVDPYAQMTLALLRLYATPRRSPVSALHSDAESDDRKKLFLKHI